MQADTASKTKLMLVLRVGLVPAWQRRLIDRLTGNEQINLKVVRLEAPTNLSERGSSLLELWRYLDSRVFASRMRSRRRSERLVELGIATHACDLADAPGSDVVVWLVPGRPPSDVIAAGPPVWTIGDAFNPALGFRELTEGESVIQCDIVRFGATAEEDEVIASAFVATDRLSLSRSINSVRAKANALLLSTLVRVSRGLTGLGAGSEAAPERTLPGLLQTLRGILRLYARFFLRLLKWPFYFDQWQLAYRLGGDRFSQQGLTRLVSPHKGFWADPFVARRGGRRFLFFEEYLQETDRGHIAAAELDDNGKLGEPLDVLRRDYHLSYPFLFEYEGDLFMVPECADSGRIEAFRCTEFPDRWESHSVLLEGVRAFDPTIVEHGGAWWMFATLQNEGDSTDDELHLFHASTPFGRWSPHPLNPVCLDVRAARPAGALFMEDGRLYRPAQDCSRRYGWALTVQEVTVLTEDDFEQVEVRRVEPDWAADVHATHTINQSCGVTLYDCEVSRLKF